MYLLLRLLANVIYVSDSFYSQDITICFHLPFRYISAFHNQLNSKRDYKYLARAEDSVIFVESSLYFVVLNRVYFEHFRNKA